MFYSHEILASPQHGVATVWLVANLGHNANNRKLSRKAIENVNVSRACDTIEKPPGAPIALRLQGSLLYGVSGIYHKHGGYLLDDTEKMWARMRTYFREVRSASNMIDFKAGKAKRDQLILVDDPNFVPDLLLPPLDFDDNGDLVLPSIAMTQQSRMSSQHSPVDGSSASLAKAPFINLDIRRSSSQASLGIAPPFDKENQSLKDDDLFPVVFGEEEELPFADFPIRIDADGNLIEEPELPPHPSQQAANPFEEAQQDQGEVQFPDGEAPIIPGDDDTMVVLGDDEDQVPIMDGAQQNAAPQKQDNIPLPSDEPLSSEPASEPQPQRKQRKTKRLAADAATHVSRSEFKSWTDNYAARMKDAHDAPNQVTIAQARNNAYDMVFGMGIGGVGALNSLPGVDHELADFFAGDSLKDVALGDILADAGQVVEGEDGRGARRRRSASVAFGSDEDDEGEDARRVRPRVDGDEQEQEQQDAQQAGHGQQDAQAIDDPMMIFGNDIPEMGREQPGSALSDHRRSSNAPWNRQESMVPSSARSGKNAEVGRNAVEDSPLVGRGSILQHSDVKFSDNAMPAFGSDGFAPMHNDGAVDLSSFADLGDAAAAIPAQEANTSQFMREALDREGRNFLGFVERVTADQGEVDDRDGGLRWVGFDDLFDEQDQTKPVVAQAFLHILTLATKNQLRVEQAGVDDKVPFGEIRVGVTSPRQEVEKDAYDGDEGASEGDSANDPSTNEDEEMEDVEE